MIGRYSSERVKRILKCENHKACILISSFRDTCHMCISIVELSHSSAYGRPVHRPGIEIVHEYKMVGESAGCPDLMDHPDYSIHDAIFT